MKIALIHDHLAQDGGAEQVLMVLKEMYPQAPIFTLIFDPKNTNNFFYDKNIKTSWLQKMPFGVSHYQWWLPFMPVATESYDLSEYDLVLSSASAFAKGIITLPGTKHICYCHTPTRYLWMDTHSYIRELKINKLIKFFLPIILSKLRLWDKLAAERVDCFIANSTTVQARIKKYYNQNSQVIYPPVNIDKYFISHQPKTYYLAGGRLVAYKKIDLVVRAFERLRIPLKVFGVGPESEKLEALASDAKKRNGSIEFLGKVSDDQKKDLFANCIAYINPQEEDFGITAIEAMACGRPVIAYGAGGATETIVEGETGEFFDEQIWEEIADKVIRFDQSKYNPQKIRDHAKKFGVDIFKQKITQEVSNYSNTNR